MWKVTLSWDLGHVMFTGDRSSGLSNTFFSAMEFAILYYDFFKSLNQSAVNSMHSVVNVKKYVLTVCADRMGVDDD